MRCRLVVHLGIRQCSAGSAWEREFAVQAMEADSESDLVNQSSALLCPSLRCDTAGHCFIIRQNSSPLGISDRLIDPIRSIPQPSGLMISRPEGRNSVKCWLKTGCKGLAPSLDKPSEVGILEPLLAAARHQRCRCITERERAHPSDCPGAPERRRATMSTGLGLVDIRPTFDRSVQNLCPYYEAIITRCR